MRSCVVIVVLIALTALLALFADVTWAAQTAPSTRPLAEDIRTWFKQLSDPAPDVRERARIRLMTMTRARLPELKRVVAAARPLTAAQAVELRQIVEHVFLSGEEYLSSPRKVGFLGVQMAQVTVPDSEDHDESSNGPNRTVARVMISTRFPGFSAYPVLRDGDVILSVVGSDAKISSLDDLPTALVGREPGTTIELEVQRAGQMMRVPVRLSPRPFALERRDPRQDPTMFTIERDEAARKYWEENFAPLLGQQTI